jgi:hypothetical protein
MEDQTNRMQCGECRVQNGNVEGRVQSEKWHRGAEGQGEAGCYGSAGTVGSIGTAGHKEADRSDS